MCNGGQGGPLEPFAALVWRNGDGGEISGSQLVGASGFEPPTPTMSRWCSNQLSYAPAGRLKFTGVGIEGQRDTAAKHLVSPASVCVVVGQTDCVYTCILYVLVSLASESLISLL